MIDLSLFEERYRNDETGRSAIDPKVLLKIVLFGYSRGRTSSRSLEQTGMPGECDVYGPYLWAEAGSQHNRPICFFDRERGQSDYSGIERRVPFWINMQAWQGNRE